MAGKGDTPRPVKTKQYNENYEAINWGKKIIKPKEVKQLKNKIRITY